MLSGPFPVLPWLLNWGRILQQHLDKMTLDLSKGSFSFKFFLYFVFKKQKLGMFSVIISYLKSKKYLKSKLENDLSIVVQYGPRTGDACISLN